MEIDRTYTDMAEKNEVSVREGTIVERLTNDHYQYNRDRVNYAILKEEIDHLHSAFSSELVRNPYGSGRQTISGLPIAFLYAELVARMDQSSVEKF